MASVNKVILVGRVGNDPEIRYTQSGDAVGNLSIATTDSWKDKATGEKRESTEWHKVNFFGKLAEIVGQYIKKGSLVYIEGSLHTRTWTDKEGIERYTTEIRCQSMQMLGSKQGNRQDDSQSDYQQDNAQGNRQGNRQGNYKQQHQPDFDDLGDDIPF